MAPRDSWLRTWPDLAAFIGGLALAYFLHWSAKDLIWSLWLSSLLVGYTCIVLTIVSGVWRFHESKGGFAMASVGGAFMLAFFTFHFGMFHFVHSVFVNVFFPVIPGQRDPNAAMYRAVFASYWPWVIVAALAERRQLRNSWIGADVSNGGKDLIAGPYKNVMRMHLLIFFFAGATVAHLDSFSIYAVVFFVYFFPWRMLRHSVDSERTPQPATLDLD